ncbi:hypothetical protein PPTG_01448 [Phytophthora nicotianae INRA-310]|uniref:Uncharacterized protein n=1 Tax=Phytophthora nicotianae (strain INRA-310) TaxID=761204 RepID=W2R707_PHYN3|nr:hypothetical protein PPTG_01448 [Phytophthora nicotianae INRA-310]ETN21182.1 hypothetical protein PPTG_01448 [Phytophthora nicotianae INRA-310]
MGEYASHEAGKGVSPGLHPDDTQHEVELQREPGGLASRIWFTSDVSAKASVGVAAGNGKAHKKPEGILRHVSGTKGATDDTVDADNKQNEGPVPGQDEVESVPELGERVVSEAGSRAGSDDSVAARAEHPDNSYITGGAPKRIFNADGEGGGAVGSKG